MRRALWHWHLRAAACAAGPQTGAYGPGPRPWAPPRNSWPGAHLAKTHHILAFSDMCMRCS